MGIALYAHWMMVVCYENGIEIIKRNDKKLEINKNKLLHGKEALKALSIILKFVKLYVKLYRSEIK